jgi:hypothetical protein
MYVIIVKGKAHNARGIGLTVGPFSRFTLCAMRFALCQHLPIMKLSRKKATYASELTAAATSAWPSATPPSLHGACRCENTSKLRDSSSRIKPVRRMAF